MSNSILIDAAHQEETRVVVLQNEKVEEFDFESAEKRPLKGNIYLAKVMRVEPSLQAAFVDFGGNRHGFLAFSEIHPDYYQIPVADKRALLEELAAEEARAAAEANEDEALFDEGDGSYSDDVCESSDEQEEGEEPSDAEHNADENLPDVEGSQDSGTLKENSKSIEDSGADDDAERIQNRRAKPRKYKIQEVIKRKQVLLIQVVKEERLNKGAALTTYLSIAGRYAVLMPNTACGGGISRKITNTVDRRRLKKIAHELDVPEGMGVIVRTAGAKRTKTEIKRDLEYLLRIWENIRDLTLRSTAPSCVHEEGGLIKRTIRDLYSKDTERIIVSGERGYREAKDFMKLLTPSHARYVQQHKDNVGLFSFYGVEHQLAGMFSPNVKLPSGGYIVINQTEALVAIDVNSGRSTRENSVENTAYQTNLEAANEIARQLRLRDLSGLIVIDFIDMMERSNNRTIERTLKEHLKGDRARIQVGRISSFGLLEMSRQRLRSSVQESSSNTCPHCNGSGVIRTIFSICMYVLRTMEDHLMKTKFEKLSIKASKEVSLYILNELREKLRELETCFEIEITFDIDTSLRDSQFLIESQDGVVVYSGLEIEVENASAEGNRRRRRNRRKNAPTSGSDANDKLDENNDTATSPESGGAASEGESTAQSQEKPLKKRKRGRRGGRNKNRPDNPDKEQSLEGEEVTPQTATEPEDAAATAIVEDVQVSLEAETLPPVSSSFEATNIVNLEITEQKPAEHTSTNQDAAEKEKDKQSIEAPSDKEEGIEQKPRRSGWWQNRRFF